MPLEKDTLIHDRYKIVETLGKGGMGAVYRAIDESLGVAVAVKENLIDDEEALRQFRREAIILANMRHPNLPRVTDHFVIDGSGQYLVMDYIEGEDLRQRMERVGKLPEKEVVLIGSAISDALYYMHNLDPPILHRDIKPGNIKITPNGHVYLVDFGLAKIVQGSQETTTGARGLTPGYSPPEQYGSARTDARSDVYSLGATLYAALTGTPPEDGLAIAINQATLTRVTERNPKSSAPLALVVEKALSVNADDRYQDALEFKDALLAASDTVTRGSAVGEMTIAPPPPGSYAATLKGEGPQTAAKREEKGKKKPWVWVGGIVGLLVVLGGAYMAFGGGGGLALGATATPTVTETALPTDTPAPTATSLPTDTPEPTLEPTITPTPTLAETPTGGSGEFAFASNRAGEFQIFIGNTDGSEPVQVTDIAGGACQPDWSPDGSQIVFTAPCRANFESYPGSNLYIVNADGSGLQQITSSPLGDYDPAWSPDGEWIAFTSLRQGERPNIHVYNVTTTEVINLSNTPSSDFTPTWSPDGKFLAFATTRLTGEAQIWFMNVGLRPDDSSREAWDVISRSDDRKNREPTWSPDGTVIIFTQSKGGGIPEFHGMLWKDGAADRGFGEYDITREAMAQREPDFSPDGRWLIFTSNPEGENNDIYMMQVNGSGLVLLTFVEAVDIDPVWRPVP